MQLLHLVTYLFSISTPPTKAVSQLQTERPQALPAVWDLQNCIHDPKPSLGWRLCPGGDSCSNVCWGMYPVAHHHHFLPILVLLLMNQLEILMTL